MSSDSSERDPLEQAAESFLVRWRAGERPRVSEYERKYPTLAVEIHDLFPALVMMEEGRAQVQGPASSGGAIPEQLGEYHLLREVGRGGMGVVYEAVQQSLGRHVALKVLPFNPHLPAEQLERFRREARAAARLHHTNIVPVFGVGEDQGVHYYAMQFIQGQGLDAVLEEVRRLRRAERPAAGARQATQVVQALLSDRFANPGQATRIAEPSGLTSPPTEAGKSSSPDPETASINGATSSVHLRGPYYAGVARIGLQAAEALDYAHRQGVIHRDIKPSNLLLDTEGRVWITDFGLAKAEEADALTESGAIVGTMRYMAPERFQGQADARSDVYALGATLYELLTLRPVFDESNRGKLLEQIVRREPTAPRRLDARLPRDLETSVLKALAKEPGRRYVTAGDLAEDLRRFLTDRPIRARRTSWREHLWRWCRRNPALAGLLASVLMLLITIALLATGSALRLRQEEEGTRRQLFRALLEQARGNRLSQRTGRRCLSLELLARAGAIAHDLNLPEEDSLELRNETIACLALYDVRLDKEWSCHSGYIHGMGFDQKLEHYVQWHPTGDISVWQVAGDVELNRLVPDWHLDPRLSANGTIVSAWSAKSGQLVLWKLTDRGPLEILSEPEVTAYDISSDSRLAAIAYRKGSARSENGSLHLFDLVSGKRVRELNPAPCQGVKFRPHRNEVAVGRPGLVSVVNVDTGKEVGAVPSYFAALAWSPDGKILAVDTRDKAIELWDVFAQQKVASLAGHTDGGISLAFNATGKLLVSSAWDGTMRLWETQTGKQVLALPSRYDSRLVFGSGDRLPLLRGNQFQLWEVVSPIGFQTLLRDATLGKARYHGLASSPGHDLLAVGMQDGVGLWNLQEARMVQGLRLGSVNTLLFEPGGDLLANIGNRLQRLSLRSEPDRPERLRLDQPQPLPFGGSYQLAASRDGRILASARGTFGSVWRRGRPEQEKRLVHKNCCSIAVSPDGAWVATGSQGGSAEVKIWAAASGDPVTSLTVGPHHSGQVAFSPDGRWLAANGEEELRLWHVPSWAEGPWVGGSVFAFSPDSQLLAVETGAGVIRLVAPASGREYARLQDPNAPRRAQDQLVFSPDGAKLIVNSEHQALHVWDLRVIREQLARRGVDWDLPPYPPPDPAPGPTEVLYENCLQPAPFGDLADLRILQAEDKVDVRPVAPPPGAIVLFDGKNLDQWKMREGQRPACWELVDGSAMQATDDDLVTRQQFGRPFHLHLEFRVPYLPQVTGQRRGNSGVYLQGRYEIQVLDSYGLAPRPNECGALYGVAAPSVNVCKAPTVWQSYDIRFHPRQGKNGDKVSPARVTVRQNGILIHDDLPIYVDKTHDGADTDPRTPGPILLQYYGSPVQYRNIWLVELNE